MGFLKSKLRELILLLAIILVFFTGIKILKNNNRLLNDKETIKTEWVEDKVKNIAEYASLSYQYSNVSEFENKKEFYGLKIPFTKKNFVVKYDGEMKLGINANEISVLLKNNEILLQIPKSKVLSHTIKEDSLKLFDQSHNIFNQIEIEDYASFAMDQKDLMVEKAKNEGVFENADRQVEEQIRGFLESLSEINQEQKVIIVETF